MRLPTLDPDKNISATPSLLYYDTCAREINLSNFPCQMPKELPLQFGVSCYGPLEHIDFCTENKLANLELRPSVINTPTEKIVELVKKWRAAVGKNLSVHLPDIVYKDGAVQHDPDLYTLLDLAIKTKVNRFTQHVPMVTISTIQKDSSASGGI